MYLPDINFWLALAFSGHQHSGSAKLWLDAVPADRRCYFCRLTQLGFLRLATNPKSNPLQVRTLSQAWIVYDDTRLDPRVGYALEPDGLENDWRQRTQLGTFSHNVWNDAYLAAFAIAGKYELVTFDKGFARYPGLTYTLLP